MGCDIHFRVEYFAAPETVILQEGEVLVAPEGEPRWMPAELMTENEWWTRINKQIALPLPKREVYMQVSDEKLKAWLKDEPRMTIAYEDRFYTGRNYSLFWKLSGVRGRGDDVEPMTEYGNGLPDDLSPEVAEELSLDDADLHSHTHFTLTQLLAEDWDAFDREHGAAFSNTILAMQVVAMEKCGGNTDHVRAVMAYDN